MKTPARGYSYVVTPAQIHDFRKLSAFEKLRLLEEMQRFLDAAMPARARRIRDRFRRGEM